MVFFNGNLKVKVCEAVDLRPTDFATRHSVGGGKNLQLLDPYIALDIDDVHFARTTTKGKTFKPIWNEDFNTVVRNGQSVGITVFHDSSIPPDDFVANCSLRFEDLKTNADIWVSVVVNLWCR
jgi:novel protein kinase C epsilon type